MKVLGQICSAAVLALALTLHSSNAEDFIFRYSGDEADSQCSTPAGEQGKCIVIQKCPPLLELLKKQPRPPGTIDFLRRSQCGVEGRNPLVCCSERRGPAVPPPPKPTRPPQPTKRPTTSGGTEFTSHPNARLLPLNDCGIQFSERIIGGEITELDEYPWLVLLQYRTPTGNLRFLCGGALISRRYVLTASHCVNGDLKGNRLVSVRLGEYNQSTEEDCVEELTGEVTCADPYVDVNVEKTIPHPDYSKNSQHQTNDIALVRLSRDVRSSEYIRPICLPVSGTQTRNLVPGKPLWVAGWGRTESSSNSPVKLKVAVPVVNMNDCQKVYNRNNRQLISSQLCAGGLEGKDSCTGDSGGPLMTSDVLGDKNIYTVAGIVSFGPRDCGMKGWPGVYTRVDAFMPWIMGELKP